MSEYEILLKNSIESAFNSEIDEIIAQMRYGKTYQIRFSNSAIDNTKVWHNSLLELFLAKDQKTTHIEIDAPTLEKVETIISQSSKFLNKMPKNFLYTDMERDIKPFQTIDKLYDKNSENFPDKAPELVNATIQTSLDSGAEKVAGVLYFGKSETNLLTGYGIRGSFLESFYRLTIRSFVTAESSGQDIVCGRDLSNVEKKFVRTGEKAGEIAKMAMGGTQTEPGKYDLIMSPTVGANVFGQITDKADPLLMMLDASPLNRALLGKKIASEHVNVTDNALMEDGLGSRPFDVEGTPTGKTPIVVNGEFTGIYHSTSTGKMFESRSTGSSKFYDVGAGSKFLAAGPSNTVYRKGDHTLEEMIEGCRKPTLYFTSNWYTRFTNLKEGIFSTIPRDGIFLIEQGEIIKPVRKLRLSDNVLRMFSNVSVLGNDIQQIQWWEVPTPTFIPTIKVDDCNITAATM